METAAGSERRSPPGPVAPPRTRGHAPLAAAPGPLSPPAREPPQPEEGQQLRISQSGQFNDGLEDRGERAARPLSPGPAPAPSRAGAARNPQLPAPAPAPGSRVGLGAEQGPPREGAESREQRPHLPRAVPPRNPRTGCLQGKPAGARALLSASLSPCPSGAPWKSLREAVFAFGAERPRGLQPPLSWEAPAPGASSVPAPPTPAAPG